MNNQKIKATQHDLDGFHIEFNDRLDKVDESNIIKQWTTTNIKEANLQNKQYTDHRLKKREEAYTEK